MTGEFETIRLAIVGGTAILGEDFDLTIEGTTNIQASILEQGEDYIVVKMTAMDDVNLTGLGFKVTVTTYDDLEDLEHVKFEIQDPSYAEIRLDKDDIGYDIVVADEDVTQHGKPLALRLEDVVSAEEVLVSSGMTAPLDEMQVMANLLTKNPTIDI